MDPGALRIIGIDPGLRIMGWGVIECSGVRMTHVASGSIRPDERAPLAKRLAELHKSLAGVIAAFDPAEAAVEETFVNRDPQSALKLGHARGIALAVPALAKLPVAEYAANFIKKTVTGSGHAEKRQIGLMVAALLPGTHAPDADAADALAVAITHARLRAAGKLQLK